MTTVARRLLRVVWELISRIVTTFMLFGIFESVRSALFKVISISSFKVDRIKENVSLLSVWQFLSSKEQRDIMVGRFFFEFGFLSSMYPLLNAVEPDITQFLE